MSSKEYCDKSTNKQWLIKKVVLKAGLTYGISSLGLFNKGSHGTRQLTSVMLIV